MWEFPHGPSPGEPSRRAALRLLAGWTGIVAASARELLTIRHSVTHHRITMTCFAACWQSGRFRSSCYSEGRWVGLDELANYPVSSPQRRLARQFTAQRVF
jgi:A/G-specific adenine glycosylase